ncbi:MAG TPA: hypothetical protein VGO93_15215 [Candidatus Xenobia bacterium]|jgi:type II secretory pathway pseudopilin PulG
MARFHPVAPGFTIIENLLAIFLLAIGIATTAYMIPAASRALSDSKLTTQAAYFAQQRMEDAIGDPTARQTAADPVLPELTGEIQRLPHPSGLLYLKVTVYRTADPTRKTVVELETL